MIELHKPFLSRSRLCSVSGLPETTVNNWNAKQRFPLYRHYAPGPGKPRLYTRGEAISCCLVACLDQVGADRNWTPVFAFAALRWLENYEAETLMRRLDDELVYVIECPYPTISSTDCAVVGFQRFGHLLSLDKAEECTAHRLPTRPLTTIPFGYIINSANADLRRIVDAIE